jgi:beta-catenin-like protein 1
MATTLSPISLDALHDFRSCKRVLLQEAELLAEDLKDLENIDDRGIKRIVAGVERRVRRNQELRIKYSDDPQRFLESELELNELLTKLSALAGEPVLYTQLVEQQTVPLLLELLQHENIDIVSPVVELFKDLTDADSVEDLEEVCTSCNLPEVAPLV